MKEAIKDWTGKIIGFIETDNLGNQVLRNFQGQIIGKYNKRLDITQDFLGRTIAKGNRIMMLLK